MFKLDTHRTYETPVSATVLLPDGSEQTGEFTAVFKVVPVNEMTDAPEDTRVLDMALIGVKDIELTSNGEVLKGDALLEAVKNDPTLQAATLDAYFKSISKKTPMPS